MTVAEFEVNHRQKGRTVPALPTVTLPDSGYTIQIRSLGPTTMFQINQAAQKEFPPPDPPINIVTGLDNKEHSEPNPNDPAYVAALADYQQEFALKVMDRLLDVFTDLAIEGEVDSDAVERFRRGMRRSGVTLPEDDRDVWVRHILISSQRDLEMLQSAVARRSQPTEAAIAEHTAMFRGDVQES